MPAHLIAEEGPYRGLILNLEEGQKQEWVIGRDPDRCDFVIEDSTVSRKAARLTREADGIYLKNISRINPTLVNGIEESGSVLLKEGDKVQIGNTVFLFSLENLPENFTEMPKPEKKKSKKKEAYDDIFGDIETPEELPAPPPEPERLEETAFPPTPSRPEVTAYDTIFEDVNEPEELPFNLVSETPLLLKVIAGPNAGAEIGIEKGRVYTIGKDPNSSDIVFQDLSVSRNHARLEVAGDGIITIEDLGSKNGTVVNGAVITERTVITPQDLVALGTTVFMVIDREAPQETIYSPMVPSYEAPKMEAPPVVVEEDEIAVKSWKKEPIPPKYLFLAGSVAVVFLIMFMSFFSLFKSKKIEIAAKEPTSEIKEALAKFNDVQFSFNPGSGKLFLVGHVLTSVDYAEMKYRIGQIDFITTVEDNVVVDEGVWKTMNDVITANPGWRSISIHSPEAGKFVVVGYLETPQQAAELSEYLTVNFPYLDRLQNKVVIEEVLNAQLQALIAQQNLGAVTFQLANGDVILSGRYNEKLESSYKRLIKEINTTSGVRNVKDFAVAAHPDKAGIDISANYQVSGSSMFDGRGYSVVLNEKIYTLGDRVDGMKITSIEPETILLEKDGLKYKIDYTGR